jgi:hypothetical protein
MEMAFEVMIDPAAAVEIWAASREKQVRDGRRSVTTETPPLVVVHFRPP